MVICWAGLSNKLYRTNDQVHRKMYKALGLSYPVRAKTFCSGTWMLTCVSCFVFQTSCQESQEQQEHWAW